MIKISKRTFMINRIVIIINFHLFSSVVSIVRRKYFYSLLLTSYCQGRRKEKGAHVSYKITFNWYSFRFMHNESAAAGKR